MPPWKIAYLLTPIEFGGSERVNLNFLKHVDRNTFDINPILLIRPWEKENVFVHALQEENYSFREIPVATRPPRDGKDYLRVFRCCTVLLSILRQNSFDLLHTHGYFADIIGIPVGRLLRIPTLSTCHGFILNDRNLRIYNFLDRHVLRLSNRITAVSQGIKDVLIQSGIKDSRVDVILNAVDTSDRGPTSVANGGTKRKGLNIKEVDFVIGYIGRLSQEKGISNLILAVAEMLQAGAQAKLLIIGDGPIRSELENLSQENGIAPHVIFTGFQTDIESWLSAIDVFVLPSLTEGSPMSVLEAMSLGIPVIASRVGGVPNIIENNSTGILVEPGNPKELVLKLDFLRHNPLIREKIAENAKNLVRSRYSVHDWCRQIEQQYTQLIKENS